MEVCVLKKLKKHSVFLRGFLLLLLALTSKEINAEGSKEITPNMSNHSALTIMPSISSGSFLNAPTENRIYFNISNLNERFYYGTNWYEYSVTPAYVGNTMYARIYGPNGVQVGGNIQLSNTGSPTATTAGHIANLTRAQNGPNIGDVSNGYNPLTFTPTATGEHYIVFYRSTDGGNTSVVNTNWFMSIYFDFTVATNVGVKKQGKVFSKKWSFVALNSSLAPNAQASASPTFYSYSLDSTVSKITFESGFFPIAYDVAINKYGVADNGNWEVDRRSVNSSASPSLPNGYKLFLNVPDNTIYSVPVIEGQPYLANPPIVGCGAPYKVNFYMPAAGDAKLLLDLNGVAGFQDGTADRILEGFDLEEGFNTLIWDGRNGLGGLVVSGANIKITATYERGRFNIPIYDAEINKNGFNVAAIAPIQTAKTRLYWDDSKLTSIGSCPTSGADQTNNSTSAGINNSIVGTLSPAHAWSGNGNPSQSIPAPAVGVNESNGNQCDDYGNVRTINTWGWALSVESNILSIDFFCRRISGTVYNDVNGLTDNTVNGTPIGKPSGEKLYAILVDANNLVMDSIEVKNDGTFEFAYAAFDNGNYSVLISTTAPMVGQTPPSSALPYNWVRTGEYRGPISTAGSDGTIDSRYFFTINNNDATQIKYGIQQRPSAIDSIAPTQSNPGSIINVPVDPNLFAPNDKDGGSLSAIRITSLPQNSTSITINGLIYNSSNFPVGGILVPTNSSGNPTQTISVDPIDGDIVVSIPYIALDNAGFASLDTGKVKLPFSLLSILKTSNVDNFYSQGDTISYRIVIKNNNSYSHTGVNVWDTLPAGVVFLAGSVTASVSNPIAPIFNSTIFNTSGTYTIPAGVDQITVEAWGGGGSGGSRTSGNNNTAFGGGGGGAYARSILSVNVSETYNITVGAGSSTTSAGADSWFSPNTVGNSLVLAKGGNSVANNSTTGATGGQSSASIGSIKYSGGNGGNGGSNPNGAGAGSSAGINANGNNGLSNGTGGTAPSLGGDGGNGSSGNGNGSNGSIPGGGGGGSRRGTTGTQIGGNGANGRVVVSYNIPGSIGTTGSPATLATGWGIAAGDSLVITYKVVVNNPSAVDSIRNTAFAKSDIISKPISSTVTDYPAYNISGSVYNDTNGMTDNKINGTGTYVDNKVYAILTDTNGNVISSVLVNSDGTYEFTNVPLGINLLVALDTLPRIQGDVVINSSLPKGWVSTGEIIGTGNGNDGNTNGISAIIPPLTQDVGNVNFGLQQPPTAVTGTLASQVNPGDSVSVTIPSANFKGNDLSGGIITNITITTFPTNATTITINGTTYTSGTFPGAGVSVPADVNGNPTQTISIDPIDGAVTSVITYIATDNGGATSASATVSVPFTTVTIVGSVFNDPNAGNVDNSTGSANLVPAGMYANLIDNNGKVVTTSIVDTNGLYLFDGINGGSYTVVLSTTQGTIGNNAPAATVPTGWVNTGEFNGTSNKGNTAPVDGTSAIFTVSTANVSNVNFGIEQPPIAVNDTNTGVIGQAVTVNVLNNDSDVAPGTLEPTTVTMIVPIGATGVVTDGNGDVTSMTIPGEGTWTVSPTSGEITFTPLLTFTGDPTPIQYTVDDNAGFPSNPATVVITYPKVNISGIVVNDVNGSGKTNGSDILTGTEIGTTAGGNLYVYLVNGNGTVIDSAKVQSDGTYTLEGSPNSTYTVELSTTKYPIGNNINTTPIVNTPPSGWVTIGEGANNQGDGTPNGTLSVSTDETNSINNNFGIVQKPIADDKIYSGIETEGLRFNHTGYLIYPNEWLLNSSSGTNDGPTNLSNGSMPGLVSGNDANSGRISGATGSEGNLTFTTEGILYDPLNPLTVLTSTVLVYKNNRNDIILNPSPSPLDPSFIYWNSTTNQFEIPNFNANNLSVWFDTTGNSGFLFNYKWKNEAGVESNKAIYSVTADAPLAILPVELVYFTGSIINDDAVLTWLTASELNNSGFEIEHSMNGIDFESIGWVNGNGSSSVPHTYGYKDQNLSIGVNYFRLKQIDYDGNVSYSQIISLEYKSNLKVSIYPVPAQNILNVNFNLKDLNKVQLTIVDVSGRRIRTVLNVNASNQIDLSNIPNGSYFLQIISNNDQVESYPFSIIK